MIFCVADGSTKSNKMSVSLRCISCCNDFKVNAKGRKIKAMRRANSIMCSPCYASSGQFKPVPDDSGIDYSPAFKRFFAARYKENNRATVSSTTKHSATQTTNFTSVRAFLESIGLERFAPVFDAEEVDMFALKLCDATHLIELGIPTDMTVAILNAVAQVPW
jgi:hypothetical protein